MNTANYPRIRKQWLTRLAACIFSLSLMTTVFADDSWPSVEAGAAAAGFSEQGIAALDLAMEQIVANQDVAGTPQVVEYSK